MGRSIQGVELAATVADELARGPETVIHVVVLHVEEQFDHAAVPLGEGAERHWRHRASWESRDPIRTAS